MFISERPIIQIAYAVKDVRKAAKNWSQKFNIGPFFINEHIKISNTLVNKKKSEFDHSSAYGWKENIMIELICDHKIQDQPKNSNSIGIHHIAWIAPDFDKEKIILENEGCEEVLSANAGHRNGMKFAWFILETKLIIFMKYMKKVKKLVIFMIFYMNNLRIGTAKIRSEMFPILAEVFIYKI